MRAKFIYEKFKEDSDPIKDLGIGLIPRYPITIKDYREMHSHNITNITEMLDFIYQSFHKVRNFSDITKLTKNNRELFLEKFGKQDFVYTNEYKNSAWSFRLPSSAIFIVFTGNRGTSYEYSGNITDNDIERIKHFLTEVILKQEL